MKYVSISMTMKALRDGIISSLGYAPGSHYVFDPTLAYDTAIQNYRVLKSKMGMTDTTSNPLFAYSRAALHKYPQNQRAFPSLLKIDNQPRAFPVYAFEGVVEMNFLYITKDMHDLENFEAMYMAQFFPRVVTVQDVSFGAFKYNIQYDDFSMVDIGSQTTFYQTVGGTIRATGMYIIVDDSDANAHNLIETINLAFDSLYVENLQAVTTLSGNEDKFVIT